jgi:hypothetical protein
MTSTNVPPFHSTARRTAVHHNTSWCSAGAKIKHENRASGTGDRPLCSQCGEPFKSNELTEEFIAALCARARRARFEQGLPERLEHLPTLEYIADILDEALEAKARQERHQALLDGRA